jgi:hypothetical protein
MHLPVILHSIEQQERSQSHAGQREHQRPEGLIGPWIWELPCAEIAGKK